MRPFWTESFGNPSSIHTPGRRARVAVEDARERIAGHLSVDPSDIIFTSGGTEAANLALTSAFLAGQPIMASRAEHEAVIKPLEAYETFGGAVTWLESDANAGVVMPSVTTAMDFQGLVASMLVNNETGVYNDPAAVRRIFPNHRTLFYADCVQAFGFYDLNIGEIDADLVSLSAHKIGGPKGVGLLCVAGGRSETIPTLRGGQQEQGRRAGTENVPGIVGFARAVELAHYGRADRARHVRQLRDQLLQHLQEEIGEHFIVNTPIEEERSAPHILNIAFPKNSEGRLEGEMLLLNLDIEGVFVSSGSACTSGSVKPSHVLLAAGVDEDTASAAVRFSLSHRTTESDIEYAVDRLSAVYRRMRKATNHEA